jgi:bacterioferritin-associated ferredoxin
MYICICNGVTDDQIRAEIRQGACTMRDLRIRLGIATCCGRCGQCARAILAEIAVDRLEHQGVTTEADAALPAQA